MNIIVVGCGRVGSHLASLLSEDGHNVSVVDRSDKAFRALGRDFNGQLVQGLGYDLDVLHEAGIEQADALAAVTSNDNTNLMTAEVARRIFEVDHVITRLYEYKRENTYMKLGIDYACGTTLVAEEIFSKIQSGHANHIDTFGNLELIRFALTLENEQEDTISSERLERDFDVRIIAYTRQNKTRMVQKDVRLQEGDVVLACVSRADFVDFSQYIKG